VEWSLQRLLDSIRVSNEERAAVGLQIPVCPMEVDGDESGDVFLSLFGVEEDTPSPKPQRSLRERK